MEDQFEKAAETLVTMKEARSRLQEVCRDRGYGKAGGKVGDNSQANAKKSSGRHPCFDCGLPRHWAGDKECTKPGQGLGRRQAGGKPKPVKQVRAVEANQTDHVPEQNFIGDPPASCNPSTMSCTSSTTSPHEASMVCHVGMPLAQALQHTVRLDTMQCSLRLRCCLRRTSCWLVHWTQPAAGPVQDPVG